MLRTSARRGLVGGTALLVGLAGLAIGEGSAQASPPLPAAQAGPVAFWGPGDPGDGFPLPSPTSSQASEAFTKVVANSGGSAIGLTADGRVELLGTNMFVDPDGPADAPDAIPTALAGKKVVDIAGDANYGNGMAVTDTGDVYTWNLGFEGWASTMPDASQLAGSKAVAISPSADLAAVVKQDGSVLEWGSTAGPGDFDQLTPPQGLTGVASVFFSGNGKDVYALKSDGTLVPWGANDAGQRTLPAVTTDASDDVDVKDVASVGDSAVALLSGGTLAAWGSETGAGHDNAPPPATAANDIVALAATANLYIAVDSTGQVYEWGQGAADASPELANLPDDVDPANITGLSANDYYAAAIQATYGYVTKPTISGTPTVGQTLTATHATFTATPDSTTGQWLANGASIAGATGTTLKLTTAQLGKTITYKETATRGTETATAISDPTAKVAAASTGGGTVQQAGGDDHATALTPAQKKLAKDKAKLKKDKKKYKKAHGHKKTVLKKKIKKDKKKIKKDKKLVKQGK